MRLGAWDKSSFARWSIEKFALERESWEGFQRNCQPLSQSEHINWGQFRTDENTNVIDRTLSPGVKE